MTIATTHMSYHNRKKVENHNEEEREEKRKEIKSLLTIQSIPNIIISIILFQQRLS